MTTRPLNQSVEIALLVLLSFLWGGSFTLIKIAIETVPPATIVLGRLALGAGLLLLLIRIRGLKLPTSPSLWMAFTVQGFLLSALPFTLISWGEQHIDSGLAGLLNTTSPLFAFIITTIILRQGEARLRKVIGLLIGFFGVAATMGPEIAIGSSNAVWGQLAVAGAGLSYATAAVFARRFSGHPPYLVAGCSLTMAMVIMIPVSFAFDQPWTLSPSPAALWAILALGTLSTGLAMIFYFRLVRTLGPVGVTSGSYLRAGFSVLLGITFLSEQLTPSLVAGLLLILLGVAIVNGQVWRGRPADP